MKNSLSINDLFLKVWKSYWNKPRFIQSGHARIVLCNYEKHIKPVFGDRDATKLTRNQIRQWHSDLSETPIAANRSLEILSRLYSFAYEWDWLMVVNPCFKLKKLPEKKRGRYASEDEIKKIAEILNRETGPAAVLLLTVLFTGARPLSLVRLSWKELSGNTISFAGKTTAESGEKETLVVPNQIVDMWRSLPQRTDGLIFGPVNYRSLWSKIRKEAGCADLWARDLRRTYATVGMSSGVDMNVISELLNHKDTQTTKLYAKLNSSARFEASALISDKLNLIIKKIV